MEQKITTDQHTDNAAQTLMLCGKLSVYTTCICALLFFGTLALHVYRNNAFPVQITWGVCFVVLMGPVLTNWQFMGVRKLLNDIIGGSTDEKTGVKSVGVGDIAKDVFAAKFGYTRHHGNNTTNVDPNDPPSPPDRSA